MAVMIDELQSVSPSAKHTCKEVTKHGTQKQQQQQQKINQNS